MKNINFDWNNATNKISDINKLEIISIYEKYSTKKLKEKLTELQNDYEAIETSINTITNILFYRENPELKNKKKSN